MTLVTDLDSEIFSSLGLADVKIEEDSEMSEEPLSLEQSYDDDEDDDRLIQEEMEFSDSEEEQDGENSCTARSKRTSTFKRNEKGNLIHISSFTNS